MVGGTARRRPTRRSSRRPSAAAALQPRCALAESIDPAIAKEQFTVLYGSYARAYERFVENAYKTTTIMLVVLGWLLSSDSARAFLRSDHTVLTLCVLLIALAALSIWATFHRLAKLSAGLRVQLEQLADVEAGFYDQHRIVPPMYLAVMGQNLLLCALIEALLARLY